MGNQTLSLWKWELFLEDGFSLAVVTFNLTAHVILVILFVHPINLV